MKDIILTLVMISISATCVQAQPRIQIEPERWNFGHSPQNSFLTHDYTVRNSGTDTLNIIRVKPGCGCTSAPIGKDKLAPGDSTTIQVTFKTGHYKNNVSKSVTVFSNDPDKKSIRFFLDAIIDAAPDTTIPFTWTPTSLEFFPENKEMAVEFENHSGEPLYLGPIGGIDKNISLKIDHSEVQPAQKTKIVFHWEGTFSRETQKASQTFTIVGQRERRITIPFEAIFTDPEKAPGK